MEAPNSVFLRVKFAMLTGIVRMVKTNPWNVVSIYLFFYSNVDNNNDKLLI